MSDPKPPMPPQPITRQLPAVKVPQTQLDEIHVLVKSLDVTVRNMGTGIVDLVTRVDRLEEDVHSVKQRQNDGSLRVRGESQANLDRDAALSAELDKEREERKALADEVAEIKKAVTSIKEAVTGFFSNKKVRFVGQVLFIAASAYAAGKGIKLLP